uniref:50S ribosomal protein L16 n=1 Tax=Heterorhabditis bacteriophora TaxID=37862 RepID=A0A1I7W7M6_HETBA
MEGVVKAKPASTFARLGLRIRRMLYVSKDKRSVNLI